MGYSVTEQRPIAVKYLKDIHKANSVHEREIDVMNALSTARHPHIMGYYGHLADHKRLFLFVEYCQGGDLKKLCSHSKVSEVRVISLFKQLLEAMVYINDKSKV